MEQDTEDTDHSHSHKQLIWTQKLYSCCIVFSCFLGRLLVSGFWSSLGIFLLEWEDYFNTSATAISWVGSITCLILWTCMPIASAISHQCSFRATTMVGGFIATSLLLITSFLAHTPIHICITFGILSFGLGLALLSVQSVLVFNFDRHLGVASSLSSTGAGIGTFLMPPVFQYLLNAYGWRGCILISSAIYANINVCGAILRPTQAETYWRKYETNEDQNDKHNLQDQAKPPPGKQDTDRVDQSKTSPVKQDTSYVESSLTKNFCSSLKTSFDLSLFCSNPSFILYCTVALLTGVSYCTPVIYIVAKAVDNGLTRFNAALLPAFIGIASILGRGVSGFLVDHTAWKPSKLSAVAYLLCGVVTLLFPFGHTFTMLGLIACGFGVTSGVYNALVMFVGKEFTNLNKTSGALAWFYVINGFGAFAGIYFSGFLKDATGHYHASFLAAGGISILCAVLFCMEPLLHRQRSEEPNTDEFRKTIV